MIVNACAVWLCCSNCFAGVISFCWGTLEVLSMTAHVEHVEHLVHAAYPVHIVK